MMVFTLVFTVECVGQIYVYGQVAVERKLGRAVLYFIREMEKNTLINLHYLHTYTHIKYNCIFPIKSLYYSNLNSGFISNLFSFSRRGIKFASHSIAPLEQLIFASAFKTAGNLEIMINAKYYLCHLSCFSDMSKWYDASELIRPMLLNYDAWSWKSDFWNLWIEWKGQKKTKSLYVSLIIKMPFIVLITSSCGMWIL